MQKLWVLMRSSFSCLEFEYDPKIKYSPHSKIIIDEMDEIMSILSRIEIKK